MIGITSNHRELYMLASFKVTQMMKGAHWIWMSPSVFLYALQSIGLSLLSQTGRTCIYTSKVQITQDSQQIAGMSNGALSSCTVEETRRGLVHCGTHKRLMPAFNYVTSTHTGILSAAPVKWCLLSWWQYVSLALHILWLPCCLPPLAPPLPPLLPTHSLILSFPSHARKSIAETNVKWLQKRKLLTAALQLCTREDEIAVWGWEVGCRRFGVVRDWMCLFKNHHFIAVRQLQEGAYLSLRRVVPKLLWQAGIVAKYLCWQWRPQ